VKDEIKRLQRELGKSHGPARERLRGELEKAENRLPPPLPAICTVRNAEAERTAVHVLRRGAPERKGKRVRAGTAEGPDALKNAYEVGAGAAGTAGWSDWGDELDTFFEPGEEILIATSSADALAAITSGRSLLTRIGARARERTLDCHTAEIRAQRLLDLMDTPRDETAEAQADVLVTRET